jgi:hypothetical protein
MYDISNHAEKDTFAASYTRGKFLTGGYSRYLAGGQ